MCSHVYISIMFIGPQIMWRGVTRAREGAPRGRTGWPSFRDADEGPARVRAGEQLGAAGKDKVVHAARASTDGGRRRPVPPA